MSSIHDMYSTVVWIFICSSFLSTITSSLSQWYYRLSNEPPLSTDPPLMPKTASTSAIIKTRPEHDKATARYSQEPLLEGGHILHRPVEQAKGSAIASGKTIMLWWYSTLCYMYIDQLFMNWGIPWHHQYNPHLINHVNYMYAYLRYNFPFI